MTLVGGHRAGRRLVAAAVAALMVVAAAPAEGDPGPHQERARVVVRDGTGIEVKLGGYRVDGVLPPRPTIVEFTPYAPLDCPLRYGEPYHHLCVHVRGTGSSGGAFDTLGPAAQRDVVDVLAWACEQPWSDGRLGLSGFSASAIVIYNSLHQELPCVETAVLGSGTFDLYRDLLYPGGIPNAVPALGVLGMISAPMVPAGPQRLQDDPSSVVPVVQGLAATLVDYLANPSRNGYWDQRSFRGDANALPILMTDGFFDVESRGAFQAFQELRDDGAHLRVFGAHDGIPVGAPDLHAEERRWFDEHLRGIDTGILDEPRVQLLLADGNRERMRYDGEFVRYDADDWPVPGTRWETLHLRDDRSGTSWSLNDGTIGLEPGRRGQAIGTAITSWPAATDPHTTSLLGVFDQVPFATDTRTADPLALAWTSEPLREDVLVAGPGNLEVVLRSLVPHSDLYTVVSDVAPDGASSPVAVGRLRTAYPHLEEGRSLVTEDGRVVQPHAYFGHKSAVDLLGEHRYHVELWPIGNRFKAGHRLRVHLVGASLFHLPTPGVHLVRVGEGGTRLHLPVLPGSDLRAALGEHG
ncbi:CocE/NonD family hydrolase [Nitriliruptoraceae bacterium ZYF776]|nr:CocE/NonD family hydrolase [Profundirhabdus halotolerans]